jgi:hypothetical protein
LSSYRFASVLTLVNLIVLAVLAFGGDVTRAAPTTPGVVRAELIELIDAKGTMRAQLKTEDDGTVVFRLRDESGQIRVKLSADKSGSGLLLADDTTEVGVHILSGMSRLTNQRATAITVAEPGGGRKTVIGAGGVR